jgi:hypothetical protein
MSAVRRWNSAGVETSVAVACTPAPGTSHFFRPEFALLLLDVKRADAAGAPQPPRFSRGVGPFQDPK